MSAHELPEDLSRWPEDPYELLGVETDISPRDLRRAYTRLIRTYKPEQYPEHFRRIREAYELILRHVEFFGMIAQHRVESEPETEAEDQPPAPDNEDLAEPWCEMLPMPQAEEGSDSARALAARGPDLWQELDDLWEQATSGQEATAYHRLRQLHETHPGSDDICIRLYWLLVVAPEVDVQRAPSDWLVIGLRANGLTGPLRELYRREMTDNPWGVLSSGSEELLRSPVCPGLLLDVADWRWQAAGRLERWDLIPRDLQTLREQVLPSDEETWVRSLILALDQIVWATTDASRALIPAIYQDIDRHVHLHTRLAEELDRLDFLMAVSEGWHKLRKHGEMPAMLMKLVPLSWTRPFPEMRSLLWNFLREVASRPRDHLRCFDLIQRRASAVLTQFGRMLLLLQQHQEGPPEDGRTPELLVPVVLEFLGLTDHAAYPVFRLSLLHFCLQEAIAPQMVVEMMEDCLGWRELAQHVANDWPLRYVFLAHQVFWA